MRKSRQAASNGRHAARLLPLLPPLHSTPIHNPNLPNAPMATASGHEGAHEAGWVQGEGEEVVREAGYSDAPQVFSRIADYSASHRLTREETAEMFASAARAMAREAHDEGMKQ